MIFLITQMLLCIALALITGGAIGWLVHRSRNASRIGELRQTIGRQHAQVQQARTDVSMITQDYDELKTRAQTEIDTLQQENKRLPSLHQNLEKSQLLVRQLMQKHEAQLRELTSENDRLNAEVSTLRDREAIHNRVRAELDKLRSQQRSGDTSDTVTELGDNALTNAESKATAEIPTAPVTMEDPVEDLVDNDSIHTTVGDSSQTASRTEVPADTQRTAQAASATSVAALGATATPAGRSTWASASVPDLEQVNSTSSSEPSAEQVANTPAAEAPSDAAGTESDSSALMRSMGIEFEDDDTDQDDINSELAPGEIAFDDDSDPLDDSLGDEDVVDASSSDSADYFDGTEQLFDPVDRHDDLKQIFGIGPWTEKALNELGITSYSQLADLKRHDIETIADALQIFPSRIERDDWVGNARRQLEDVLEEL